MKNIKLISFTLVVLMLVAVSCQDEERELGETLTPSQIDFEVTQDLAADPGGNTVILRNNTPGTIPVWDYGTGRSTRQTDTVRFAFKGEYSIKLSVATAGGLLGLEPVTVVVTEDNLNYVNDPLWTALSGGVGSEKTWILDIDAMYFDGPMYFYGTDNGWLGGGGPWANFETGCYGDDCWNWSPEYAGNTWLMPYGDYGTMTFSLKDGPFFRNEKPMEGGIQETGTYFLDTNTKTLTINDATILRGYKVPDNRGIPGISNWTDYIVFSLDENTMQLGVIRDKDVDGEGPAMLVYNFISKEYADNWVPEEPEGDPNFDHGDQQAILAVTTTKTWKFDLEVPYNWTNLEGDFLNSWNSRADIVATGWAPYGDGDVQNIDEAAITFGADGSVVVKQDDGSAVSGTYTIDAETNIVTFEGVTPNIPIASWVSATTTDENQWKIVVVERAELTGEVQGIWFGKRDPVKAEYMVFHFVQR